MKKYDLNFASSFRDNFNAIVYNSIVLDGLEGNLDMEVWQDMLGILWTPLAREFRDELDTEFQEELYK